MNVIPFYENENENETAENIELSPELKSTIHKLIITWINMHRDQLEKEVNDLNFHTRENANTYLKDELFYQWDRWSFGKYLKDSNQIREQHLLEIIQYCCIDYSENGYINSIDFTRITDLEYIGIHFGRIYLTNVYEDIDIVEIFEGMNAEQP